MSKSSTNKMKISQDTFIKLCIDTNFNVEQIKKRIKKKFPTYDARPHRILKRIESYRKKGLLPLASGNSVSLGEVLSGTTTLYDEFGNVKHQYVKTNVPKQQQLDDIQTAISSIVTENIKPLAEVPKPKTNLDEELATVYISNDLHMGAYMWHEEVKTDWDIDIASETIRRSYDYLMDCSPSTKIGIVVDLGDLTEVDDFKNVTPKSGHSLDVDGRYPKILRAAYESLIYGVLKALEKHELVYFYNIEGNHDISTGTAVREVIRMAFKDNPRVIVDETPLPIKYHQHGNTLLQFAHGDGLRMRDAGEVMAHDCVDIFSTTKHRYAHFGHVHKDSSVDTRLCKAESHRNLAPLNHWAFHKGFRGPLGTMKSITYSSITGEKSRQLFNVDINKPE